MINLARLLGRAILRLAVGAGLLAVLAGVVIVVAFWQPSDPKAPTGTAELAVTDRAVPEGATLPGPNLEPGPSVVGDEPQPPHTFGDNAALDDLWVLCDEGSGSACDRLFNEAPLGSGYERFGVSCGERPDVLNCYAELNGLVSELGDPGHPVPFAVAREEGPSFGFSLPSNSR